MATVEPPNKRRRLDTASTIKTQPRFSRKARGKAPQREPSLPAASTTTPPPNPSDETSQEAPGQKKICCDAADIYTDDEGHMICRNCYTQISNSNIVSEVTFEETGRGAATVQGDFIRENARHASTLGRNAQRIGGMDKNAQAETERAGREKLTAICTRLGMSATEGIIGPANNLYTLAASPNFNFCAGRRTDEVVAACFYAVCRKQRDNTVMLVDIAEIQRTNVFRLGEVYKDLCRELYIGDDPTAKAIGSVPIVDVESMVMKYCRKLQFDDATRAVAEDAVRIIRRMKRDWMVTGRHPSGLCGAAIILAARMNNFRRSVREVVWVSKVADMTIMKRVQEFRNSRAAAMTVDQFRQFGPRFKPSNDPPILYESEVKKMKFEEKKRKRQESNEVREGTREPGNGGTSIEPSPTPGAEEDESEERRKRQRTTETLPDTPAPTQDEPRRDAEGFLIPPLPSQITQAGEQPPEGRKRKRGRPKKDIPPVVITEEELITEQELVDEIEYVLDEGEITEKMTELEKIKVEENATRLAEQQKLAAAEKNKARRESEGITWFDRPLPAETEEISREALETEFADDPEVQNCLLTEHERSVKEKIWLFNNEDWLRQQQEKKMIETVAKESGRNEKGKKGKGGKRKRGKMGDGTTVKNANTPPETAGEAVNEMHKQKRHDYAHFNTERIYALFQPASSSGSSPANTGSVAGSQTPEAREGGSPEEGGGAEELDFGADGGGSPEEEEDDDGGAEDYERAISPTRGGWGGFGGVEDFGDDQEY